MQHPAVDPQDHTLRHTFPTIRDFYNSRGGLTSVESDYGGYNWDDGHLTDCNYCISRPWACPSHRLRLTYVHDTGDFYAKPPAGPGPILLN